MGRFSLPGRAPVRMVCGLALLLVGTGLMMSCGRGSFVGRQYDDLTAYYNAFYNANQAFEKGLESVNESEEDIDRAHYLSVFPAPQGDASQSSFENAIQKSADVLREHPNSEWVDDALLLIGRARYHQQNYVGAAQKFREVTALDAEREGEARFRLTQTLVAADRYPEAAEALRAGLDRAQDHGSWTARMRVVRGELFVRQERWTEAEQALARGLEGDLPGDTGARAAFLLGQVRETLERPERARAAYRQALEYDPPYPLEFAAALGEIEMEGMSGAPKQALRRLSDLERDDNTREMRADIARARARLLRVQGRPDRAKRVLREALWGDEAPRGDGKGQIHYELGTLYRDTYEDFTRAAAHFDTAATTLSSGRGRSTGEGEEAQALPRAPSDAAAQANRFRRLAERSQSVARMDSLLRLGRMGPAEFQSVVEEVRQRRLEAQEAQAQRTRQQPQFRDERRTGVQEAPAPSSEQSAVQTQGTDAGFLFHRDPALVQQGRRQFEQTWGDRPLMDDWRRAEAIRGQQNARPSADQTEENVAPESSADPSVAAGIVDVSAVPRDSASRVEMEDRRAVARYELANALFRAAGRPDSAQTWFRRVLRETPEHSVAPQALYGLAQAHQAQGDTAAGNDAYRRLIETHPETPTARRAREQLGLRVADEGPERRISPADSAYGRAYEAWRDGAYKVALKAFLTAADAHRETRVAPRALLAAGVVYYRTAQHDSSGHGRVRFERHVDSLARVADPDPLRDTTEASRNPAASPRQPPGSGAPPSALDTADADGPEGPPRRLTDSTAATRRRLSGSPSDSAVTSAPAPSDVTGEETRTESVQATLQAQDAPVGPLATLLVHLTDRYPETPEGKRARALLAQLREQRAVQRDSTKGASGRETSSPRRRSNDAQTVVPKVDSLARDNRSRPRNRDADSLARPRRGATDTTRSEREGTPSFQRRDPSVPL
ncbi:tetratricopeptide repeat protein [Salinibacter altiplanensis]|uniref:type IX secretion system periplasmic lipoprotein PorW/SprE n=1 Tax=Salinibacter altiplanensis TaxID=1803181 RepID=UPI000C9F8FA7|nr:tetratricopeptide repeat protein [Salinibacter altiplanensis]